VRFGVRRARQQPAPQQLVGAQTQRQRLGSRSPRNPMGRDRKATSQKTRPSGRRGNQTRSRQSTGGAAPSPRQKPHFGALLAGPTLPALEVQAQIDPNIRKRLDFPVLTGM
jgi:hypothetical protein